MAYENWDIISLTLQILHKISFGFGVISDVCYQLADVSADVRAHFQNARSYKSNFRHVISTQMQMCLLKMHLLPEEQK